MDPASSSWTAFGPPDAPAIVFVHGTRLTRAQWWPQLRRLSGAYRCIAIDLPAHGARSAEPFTLDAEVPSGRAVIVGLSLGGFVAIDTAERHPERVAGLVIAGCTGEALGPAAVPFETLARMLEQLPAGVLKALNLAYFRARYRPAIADPIVAGGFWSAGGAQAVRALIGRRYLDRLARIWTPVLVINGTLDPVFGPGGEVWASSCRRGRHVAIPWAGHLSNLDRPATFAREVEAFVGEIAREAPAPD
jgi:pimeloyl-ACP methyl ester carboxylesterase